MVNPILQRLMPNQPTRNNPLQEFIAFKQQMSGKNPQQMIQQLLQSGQMTQQQFSDLQNQAQSILSMIKK